MSNLIGQTLGRYHILEQLGEGGMATVYKARDLNLDRDVAVKVIRTDVFAPAILERMLMRFQKEGRALGKLTHPNIVPILDYGEYEGAPYLVMPYLPGGTLKQKLTKPVPYQEAIQMLVPIARALAHAHQQGIIHRDIKSSNILITKSGEPMLSDFGIAKVLDAEETHSLTGTGVGIGTPEYMAPEQGLGQADERSDIYSLGVVLYEMITGRIPFRADTPMAILLKKTQEPLPRPSQYVPDVPAWVENILIKALARDPNQRYQTMGGFLEALEHSGRGEPSTLVARRTPVERGGDQSRTLDERETPYMQRAEPSRTVAAPPGKKNYTKWLLAAIGGVILLFMCAIGIFAIVRLLSDTGTASTEEPVVTELPGSVVTDLPGSVVTELPGSVEPVSGEIKVNPQDQAEMVFIPAGEFQMGSDWGSTQQFCEDSRNANCTKTLEDAYPLHNVLLDAYWIYQTEVTNAMFAEFVNARNYQTTAEMTGIGEVWKGGPGTQSVEATTKINGANWRDPTGNGAGLEGISTHPVVQVSWEDAWQYCQWAGGRLPTEAEWEKAARGNTASTYPWGSEFNCANGNYDDETMVDKFILEMGWEGCDRYNRTAPVGSFLQGKSPYGVFDMSGNVWEWVSDWYGKTYYVNSPMNNPTGPASGTYRVYRGGSWFTEMVYLNIAFRQADIPSYHEDSLGFRCVVPGN